MEFEKFNCPSCSTDVHAEVEGYINAGSTVTVGCPQCKQQITGKVCLGLNKAYLDIMSSNTVHTTKYNWDHAPDGANYGIVFNDGQGFWSGDKPSILCDRWIIVTRSGGRTFFNDTIGPSDIYFTGDWKDSLEERPT